MKISDTLYFTNSYLFLGKIWTPFSGKFGNPNRPPCKVGGGSSYAFKPLHLSVLLTGLRR